MEDRARCLNRFRRRKRYMDGVMVRLVKVTECAIPSGKLSFGNTLN